MYRNLLFAAALVLQSLATLTVWGQPTTRLTRALDAVLDRRALDGAMAGAVVIDAETGETLYEREPKLRLMPASNVKLYTVAAALDRLGPDFHYVTRLYLDGPITGGILRGNLIVRGSGDPTIGSRLFKDDPTQVFRLWADSLRRLGIRRIQGDIIGDDDYFDDIPLPEGWNWDDEPYWYAAESGALVFNESAVEVEIRATRAGRRGLVSWEPFGTDYVEIINETRTTSRSSSLREGYARERGANTIRLSSRVPEGSIDREALTISNPTQYFVYILRETLLREGIEVEGEAVDADDLARPIDYYESSPLPAASYQSPDLDSLARVINKESINLYADQVLRTLGAELGPNRGLPGAGSIKDGLVVLKQALEPMGVDTTRIQLYDGSGLSRLNLVSAEATARLLVAMWNHPDPKVRRAFIESLAVGGVDGSLKSRFTESSLRGRVRAKTGTLSNASALSGYVETAGGRTLAFSLLFNNYLGGSRTVRAAQDAFVSELAGVR